jgi:hypothetical protein
MMLRSAPREDDVTTGGWIFLVVSLCSVWSLAIWCFYRVLSAPSESGKE